MQKQCVMSGSSLSSIANSMVLPSQTASFTKK